MNSLNLTKAREFEKQNMVLSDTERPVFHVTPPIGWMNDPNGFSLFQNRYHLFFQYHPYSTKWGPMHWGHVVSDDFIKWNFLPCAMAPDSDADAAGCYSGSAVETPDGKHLLMYTGTNEVNREDGSIELIQRQCIAIGDGIDYQKYEANPVLDSDSIPKGASKLDFRDPKIWYDEEDNQYYAVIGNRQADDSGAILLYRSKNGYKWEYVTVLDASCNEYGKMWECPDLFPINGKYMLLVSPQEMTPIDLEFHAGYGTVALIGDYNKENHKFDRQYVQAIDYGIDFYAPQTLKTPDGRRIMIAWMQNWTNVNCQPSGIHIFGSMTLPRELELKNNRLYQKPVRELENYYGRKVSYNDVVVSDETELDGVSGRVIDMTVNVRPIGENCYQSFKINLAKDEEHRAVICYTPDTNTLRIDRTYCGGRFDIVHTRDFLVTPNKGKIKLRAIMDKNSVELFVNDGESAATFIIYAPPSTKDISFEANGTAQIDVVKYNIKLP